MIKSVLIVGIGSFIGGTLRYLISLIANSIISSIIPYSTLIVNIIGCFLIGIVFALSDKTLISNEIRLFLATGVLGGFTTFSAFSNESITMIRDGNIQYAAIYITISLVLGLSATFIGMILTKIII